MAQSVITGTVLSIEDETPVVGASVKVQGTNDGAVTDMYGRFSLKNVKSGTKLVISYIGMKSRTVMARQNMRAGGVWCCQEVDTYRCRFAGRQQAD